MSAALAQWSGRFRDEFDRSAPASPRRRSTSRTAWSARRAPSSTAPTRPTLPSSAATTTTWPSLRGWATMGRSSADPGKLLDYGGAASWPSDDLRVRAVAVAYACRGLLGAAADPLVFAPGTGELGDRVADLAADWAHLDAFVGDRRVGFASPPCRVNGDRAALAPAVVHADDSRVRPPRGQVGFADR